MNITIHEYAPIIGAILAEKETWERIAEEYEQHGDRAAAVTARGKARVADSICKRVTEVVTGTEVA